MWPRGPEFRQDRYSANLPGKAPTRPHPANLPPDAGQARTLDPCMKTANLNVLIPELLGRLPGPVSNVGSVARVWDRINTILDFRLSHL